ncbi:restriction endonuclease, SacI family [Pseudoclavibacter alba]|uniref:Restriction endonuclease, SacI family n=1 Tax=Pseudoclavibacter albus TaxID=272241 RepID=A0ABT2HY69_9MICO|nr:restriction endonuclease, SacI family [Pseudoclavibacter alba]MCT2043096.1 restriction endonuclease, SacI family [Pseudoclavibacter alba]
MDLALARSTFDSAVSKAQQRDEKPSIEWLNHARSVFRFSSKSYTPVFATVLLGRATDPTVDPWSIKQSQDNPNSYSIRTLGENALIPGAREANMTLRTTGPQPFNNSPWGKFDRIDQISRVKNRAQHDEFIQIIDRVSQLDQQGAFDALVAFIRVSLDEASSIARIELPTGTISQNNLARAVDDFLGQDMTDRPRRLQAFAAACLDLNFSDVHTRRLNDPSRDVPGDVQAFIGDEVVLSIEVRGKTVSKADIDAFVDRCAAAGIHRCGLFVDAPNQPHLELSESDSVNYRAATIHFELFNSAEAFLNFALFWSEKAPLEATTLLANRFLARLKEIETPSNALEQWRHAITLMQN